MAEVFSLGGRRFVPIGESTIEHDFNISALLRGARLDEFTAPAGSSPEAIATEILDRVLQSGKAFEILGCLLLPEGMKAEDWTPALGAETADQLRGLTAREDKAVITALTVSLIIGFFESGLGLRESSPTSSVQPDERTRPPAVGGIGTRSSGRLLGRISTGLARLFTGRFGKR
jgi:hypothetical protein